MPKVPALYIRIGGAFSVAERIIKRVDKAAMTVPLLPQTIRRYKRVAAYARVSTASDEQMNSVEAQKDYFEKMILHHENWVLAGIYADEGISGTSIRQRKAFLEMIDDAMARKIDLIVTKSVSRFARNTVDTLNTIRQLKAIGVEVYFEKENIYTLDTKGEFLITLMSSLAEEEARSLSENVKWGKRKAFSDGRYTLPYKRFLGYKKGTDNLPEIIPTEAQIVRWIYYLYLIGTATSTISKILTQVGIPTPGNKNRWSPTTIDSILQNEKYCGAALLQKGFTVDYRTKKTKVNRGELPQYYIEHDHDPIIPKEIFDEVQNCRRSRKRAGESHTLFANQLYCSECGSAYGPRRWHSTTQNDTVWECIYSYRNGRCCSSPHLYECLLIPIFRGMVNGLLERHSDVWVARGLSRAGLSESWLGYAISGFRWRSGFPPGHRRPEWSSLAHHRRSRCRCSVLQNKHSHPEASVLEPSPATSPCCGQIEICFW